MPEFFRYGRRFLQCTYKKRRRGIPKLRYNPSLLYVRHARGMSALRISKPVRWLHPLAASVGRIRWLQEKILPSTDFFGSIYTGQNELRKNDGVTPVCFWKVAEKWLLS